VSWQTNCTFCHGAKTPVFTTADLANAGPPDDIQQRFDGIENLDRSGRHRIHLFNGGFAPAPDYPCASCHTVPSAIDDPAHITVDRRADVAISKEAAFPGLTAAELARLPTPLGTYNPVDGSCSVYCHGSTMQGGVNTFVRWTSDFDTGTPLFSCDDCHGSPPLSGSTTVGAVYPPTSGAPTNTRYCGLAGCSSHLYHRNAQGQNGYDSCANCHYGSAQGFFNAGLHANGKPDVVFTPPGTPTYKSFTATWDPAARTCTSSCHVKSGPTTPRAW
jgi:hypothetical protein